MSELKAIESATAVIGNVHLVYTKDDADRYIAHQKYKRCLAMVVWCDSEMNYWYDRTKLEQHPRFKFYEKWYKRWLELADNFKEAK